MYTDEYIILQQELNNLEKKLSEVERRLKAMGTKPHSIVVRVIGGKPYYYEEWREDGRLLNKSLGPVSPGMIADIERDKIAYDKLLIEMEDLSFRIDSQKERIAFYKKALDRTGLLEDYVFEVYWKNDLSARVSVRGSRVRVKRIIKHPVKQIFPAKDITRNLLNEILVLRCFDRNRPDAREKLKAMGLSEYRPIDIVRKTHGVSYNDFIWFRFMGEDIRAEDVMVRDWDV